MAQPTTHGRTLRLFGVSTARASAVLRQAAAEGCPGLRLMGRNGELAVRLAASGPDAASVCEGWEKKLQERFGAAVFSTDATDRAEGNNYPSAMNFCIVQSETNYNTACTNNPAPQQPTQDSPEYKW